MSEKLILRLSSHPQPCSSSAMLRYQLEYPGEIRIVLYDLAGRRVHEVVKARQGELTQMLELAELVADKQVPGLLDEARANGHELLGHEVDRLVALQKVNPGVRDAEIEFFREQLRHFEKALQHARLRLDAVRVIVAI